VKLCDGGEKVRASHGRLRLCLLGAVAFLLGVAGEVGAAEPLKIGFVYVGPVGDAGWTFAHDRGRLMLEKELAGKVKTTYVENVAEGADAERVIRQLAADGNKVIFTTSFGFMNATVKVAQAYPDVIFQHATGYKTAKNLGVYDARFFEGAYLLGVLAGKMTKSNSLGFVASFPIPEVVRNIDAFTLGARSVNPKVKTKVIWVNAWYDPAKERQAAETLVAQGADVMAQNTDSPAVLQVAQDKGVYAFGWDSDMEKFAPKSHLSASTNNWGVYYVATIRQVLDGTWKSGMVKWGLKENLVVMSPVNAVVPADGKKAFEEKKKAIIDGKFQPFQGPIKDQSGAIKVAAGSVMSNEDFMNLNWYVEGVEGSLPK
jgi:basic membrane protein A and related proteins